MRHLLLTRRQTLVVAAAVAVALALVLVLVFGSMGSGTPSEPSNGGNRPDQASQRGPLGPAPRGDQGQAMGTLPDLKHLDRGTEVHDSNVSVAATVGEVVRETPVGPTEAQLSPTPTRCSSVPEGIEAYQTHQETVEAVTVTGPAATAAIPYDPEDLIRRTEIQDPSSPVTEEGCESVPETPVLPTEIIQ